MSFSTLRGRLGAHTLHATHDSRELTANARVAFLARFEREVDPDDVLAANERRRRATHALRAHMTRLALQSAKARRAIGDDADGLRGEDDGDGD
jgi:hypothetical protein